MIDNFQIEDMVEQTQRFVSYKAYNKQSGRKCLLKRYLVDETTGIGRVKGWQEEFMAIIDEFSRIEQPSLRSLISGGLDPQDGNPFAVFEWFEVSSLSQVVQNNQNLDISLTKEMATAILGAMSFMHDRGVINGDVSPQSIYYTDSEEKNPWVLNWDPVRSLRCRHGVNRAGLNIYVAPELSNGGSPNVSSDIYALGKSVEKVAGNNAEEPTFANWLGGLTAQEPGYRFGSAQQALESIPTKETSSVNRLLVGANIPSNTAASEPTKAQSPATTKPLSTAAKVAKVAPTAAAAPTAPQTYRSSQQAQKAPIGGAKKKPSSSPKKKSGGNGMLITLISLSVLLFAGVGFLLTGKKEVTPQPVLNTPYVEDMGIYSEQPDEFEEFEPKKSKSVDPPTKPKAVEVEPKETKPKTIAPAEEVAEVSKGITAPTSEVENNDHESEIDKSKFGANVFYPSEVKQVEDLANQIIKVVGEVSYIGQSKSKKTTYLNFKGASYSRRKEYISVQASTKEIFDGASEKNIEEDYVGKKVLIEGKIYFNTYFKAYYLQVLSVGDIKVLD